MDILEEKPQFAKLAKEGAVQAWLQSCIRSQSVGTKKYICLRLTSRLQLDRKGKQRSYNTHHYIHSTKPRPMEQTIRLSTTVMVKSRVRNASDPDVRR